MEQEQGGIGGLGWSGLLIPRSLPRPTPPTRPSSPQLRSEILALGKGDPKRGGAPTARLPLPTCFVPSSGCLGTAAALTYGLYCFHRGQSQRSQFMMRTRIAAQGFTVAAILLGLAASAMKSRP